MAFYYILYFVICFASLSFYITKTSKIWQYLFFFILLFFVAAFRSPDSVKDYGVYIEAFQDVKSPINYFISFSDWLNYEPLYYLLPSFYKLFFGSGSFLGLIILLAFIGVYYNLKGVYLLTPLFSLGIIVYYANFFLLHEMTQIRAGIASGLLLYGIYLKVEKRYLHLALIILIATLLHYSAILISILFLFSATSFRPLLYLSILFGAVVFSFFDTSSVFQLIFGINFIVVQKMSLAMTEFGTDQNEINIFNSAILMNMALVVWLLLFSRKIIESNKYAAVLLKMQVLALVMFFSLSSVSFIAFRMYEFFGIVSIVTIPFIFYTIKEKWVSIIVVLAYSFIMLSLNIYIVKLLEPYKLVFG